jgi:HEAT repeat protein
MRSLPEQEFRGSRMPVRVLALLGALLAGAAWVAAANAPPDKPDPARSETAAADEQRLREAKIGTDGPALLDFFRKRTVTDAALVNIQGLIRQMGDDSFEVRQKASAELAAVGPVALPLLKQATKDSDVEIARRAEDCIHLIEQDYNATVVPAAVRLLALRRPAGAVDTLLAYVPFADDETVADEVRTALASLAVRDGKPDPALVAALADKSPQRRVAAGVALCRANVAGQRDAVRKLLEDRDAGVRLRVALALVAAREKEAVPVLIALLGDLPPNQAWQAEDVLYRLAEDKAPTVPEGTDEAGRRKYRDAWTAWWREQGPKVDLAKLDATPELHGYTMMILLDQGRLLEVDADNKERWHIDGLQFPLDAQMLPGERVLVAENAANRVTERNLKGEVLWETKADAPLMAQRLPNGNTFIGTRTRLFEVTREGKEVFTYARPGGEMFMRAAKLRNGDIACVVAGSHFVRLDPAGKERQSFPVDIQTYGGRIEVLPNGRVLVPQYGNNKVVEQDGQGKVVWEAEFAMPIIATRLPNGHTLITSFNQQRAVEIDPNGKEVWEYKTETRVTRAWRR